MKNARSASARGLLLLALLFAGGISLQAQINSWTNPASGKWEGTNSWSLGPPAPGQSIRIVNSGSKTVTIDATTSGNYSNTMSISNLTVFGTGGSTNGLTLTNAGLTVPLQIADSASIGATSGPGSLKINNSAVQIGRVEVRRGTLTLNGGVAQLDILCIGNDGTTTNGSGIGSAVFSNSTVSATTLLLGSTAGGLGSLTVQTNATVALDSDLTLVSGSLSSTSSLTLNGGSFVASNGLVQVGPSGNALMTISGGNHIFRQIKLGSTNGTGSGGLHLRGGFLKILGNGTDPGDGLVSNWILWSGGDLDGSGTSVTVGLTTDSEMNMPVEFGQPPVHGQVDSMYLGAGSGFTGTFIQSGLDSEIVVSNKLIMGDCVSDATGYMTLNHGTLFVTNELHTAVLDVRKGAFTLNAGGTLIVDKLIITNSCGHFTNNGGTLSYNSRVLSPNLDADNDGLSNGLEEYLGMDPLNPSFLCTPPGLVSWWPAGGNANDVIGGNDGTLQNGATFAGGSVGQAFSFDGIDDLIVFGSGPIPPPWTAEMWVNRQDSPSHSSVLLADGATGLKLEQTSFTRRVGFSQFGVNDYAFDYIAPVGVWVHLAFVADGAGTALYVNGVLQEAISASIALPRAQLGSDSYGDRLKGLVDELSIYNRALAPSEIQDIYAAGGNGKCLPPVYILDVSISGNNVQLSWLAQPGITYRVQFTSNLFSGPWVDLPGPVTATSSIASTTDSLRPGGSWFYRVVTVR